MKTFLIALITISLISSCKNAENNHDGERTEMIPEPDKVLREANDSNLLAQAPCIPYNSDTSLAGITLRDAQSTLKIVGKSAKIDGGSPAVYLSSDKKELLTLTVHPGDNQNQVSVLNLSYAGKNAKGIQSAIKSNMETSAGIQLGMNKNQVVEKLGSCYTAQDSILKNITLNYRIESGREDISMLLKKYNMPVYFAKYVFQKDELQTIEFGFEAP